LGRDGKKHGDGKKHRDGKKRQSSVELI